MADLKDGRVLAYGTSGGDGQPQTQAQIFERHIRHGVPLEEALDAPRWLLGRSWGAAGTDLRFEARTDDRVIAELQRMGHQAEAIAAGASALMGEAGAVTLYPDRSSGGAHDPRAEGAAAGI